MEPGASAPAGMAAIAAAAGVAVSTVSRALSGAPGVSPAKRAEILEIARSVGYLAPEGGRTQSARARITAVVPEADRWAFGSILTGLHEVLTGADASLTVLQGASGADRARLAGAPGLYREADVVVLVPLPAEVSLTELQRLRDRLVVAGSVVPGVPSVGIDDVEAGQKATNYLVNTGYRNIAFATYSDHQGTHGVASRRRGDGFVRTMERAGLDPSRQIYVPFGANAGAAAAERLLAGDHLPEAVVMNSDEMAAGAMVVLRRAGVRVPEDLALIGFDDHPIAEMVRLTTIAQPVREQGRLAATMALTLAAGGPVPDEVTLPTRLVVRESTTRPHES